MRDPKFLPEFSDSEGGLNFTLGRKKPQTNNSTYYDPTDLYKTSSLASDRSFNIGCTGSRKVIVDSGGGFKFAPCATVQTYISIMASMPKENRDRRYFSFDPTENLYDVRDSFNDNAYSGFNYKDQIFKRTLAKTILRDPIKESILAYVQKVVFGLIESTKQIKNFVNYTVKKNNKRVF